MPTAPLRPCAVVGCSELVRSGRCARHARQRDQARGTARERGYTSAWDRASAAFLKAHPVCALCGRPAEVTDHVVPHKGDKQLFWDRQNWRPLCQGCNKREGIRLAGGFGR